MTSESDRILEEMDGTVAELVGLFGGRTCPYLMWDRGQVLAGKLCRLVDDLEEFFILYGKPDKPRPKGVIYAQPNPDH